MITINRKLEKNDNNKQKLKKNDNNKQKDIRQKDKNNDNNWFSYIECEF